MHHPDPCSLNAPLPSRAATGLDRRFAQGHPWFLGLVVLMFLLQTGPSAQAQSWTKRQYQNITARFNGLYYARLRYDEAMQEIHRNHKDDYAQWLPVFVESLDASVASGNSAFEESIKKCSNLIQRKEHSRWVDDGFLLIGQCYYLRRDYFDAIEAFQYVIKSTKVKRTQTMPLPGWFVLTPHPVNTDLPKVLLKRPLKTPKRSPTARACSTWRRPSANWPKSDQSKPLNTLRSH